MNPRRYVDVYLFLTLNDIYNCGHATILLKIKNLIIIMLSICILSRRDLLFESTLFFNFSLPFLSLHFCFTKIISPNYFVSLTLHTFLHIHISTFDVNVIVWKLSNRKSSETAI